MSAGKAIVAGICGVGVTIIASHHMNVANTAFIIEGLGIPWVVIILVVVIIAALALMRGK